jgi:outer membrane protein, multidrug efflux system
LRFDEGIASVIDVYQAESSLAAAEKSRADQVRRSQQAENALAVLLGRNPGPIARSARLGQLVLPGSASAGLPAELLQRRPDIRAAEEALRGAEANLSAARKAFLPSISLTTLLGFVSPDVSQLMSGDRYAWSVQPALNLPLFDAGRLRFNVRAAEAQREMLVEQYKASIRQAFRETHDALVGIEQFGLQQTAGGRAAAADEARLKTAQARYFSGLASYFEVLDAERQLLDSEISLSQIRRSLLQAYVQLYRALGGGWEIGQADRMAPDGFVN